MRRLSFILCVLALAACQAHTPLSVEVVRSEMIRCPQASYLDGQEGKLKWNYTTGLELKAFLDVYERYGDESVKDYVNDWYDAIIDSTGCIYKYKKSNYSQDHICPGRALMTLWSLNPQPKYRAALDTLYAQLQEQPRTFDGGFWHKAIYPGQMWLDGLYMTEPFYAEYTLRFVQDSLQREANYADIVHQFTTVYDHTLDPATGLLRHAWDSTGEMFWCNPETGQSDHAWGRALGWYCMALVDVAEILPQGSSYKDTLIGLLRQIYGVLPLYAEPVTGMWYQVLDQPGREGNYLEATASAMFVYAWLKGARLGYLPDREGAEKAWKSLLETFVRKDEQGLVNLDQCCEVAGLGGKQNRRGDYDYYINEPVRSNDPKGIGPLIWAALEYENL